jgi:hypothetical protein
VAQVPLKGAAVAVLDSCRSIMARS